MTDHRKNAYINRILEKNLDKSEAKKTFVEIQELRKKSNAIHKKLPRKMNLSAEELEPQLHDLLKKVCSYEATIQEWLELSRAIRQVETKDKKHIEDALSRYNNYTACQNDLNSIREQIEQKDLLREQYYLWAEYRAYEKEYFVLRKMEPVNINEEDSILEKMDWLSGVMDLTYAELNKADEGEFQETILESGNSGNHDKKSIHEKRATAIISVMKGVEYKANVKGLHFDLENIPVTKLTIIQYSDKQPPFSQNKLFRHNKKIISASTIEKAWDIANKEIGIGHNPSKDVKCFDQFN